MSAEQNKANDRRVIEGLNQGSVAVFEEVAVPNYVGHESSTTMQGREAYKQFLSAYLTAFPDLHFTIEDQVAEGDKIATRITARGTHQGSLIGIPPTGKQITVTRLYITRYADGKAEESWLNFDALGMLQPIKRKRRQRPVRAADTSYY